MAKFTSTAKLNIWWRGIWEFSGDAGTQFSIPDTLYDEFNGEMSGLIPGLTWVSTADIPTLPIAESDVTGLASDLAGKAAAVHTHAESSVTSLTSDLAAKFDKTGGTISGAVTVTGALTAQTSVITPAVTATSARFKGDPVYNVKAYGAAGDNSTDDSSAVQSAITAASAAGGGEVFFPAGSYKLNTGLLLKSHVNLRGVGHQSVLIAGADVTIIQAASSDSVDSVVIRDIKVAGFGTAGTTSHGALLSSSTRVSFDRCWFDNGSLANIQTVGASYTRVVNCRLSNNVGFQYPALNLTSASNRCFVYGNETQGGSWVSVAVENSDECVVQGNSLRGAHTGVNVYLASNRNRILGNDCSTTGSGISIDGGTVAQCFSNVVQGNNCHNNSSRGILVNYAPKTIVIGNNCASNAQDAGIFVTNGSDDTIVEGNICEGNTGRGIHIALTGARVQIVGNKCFGNTQEGIRASTIDNVQIIGNNVRSNGFHGILNTGKGFSLISGNYVIDNGTASASTYSGIAVDSSRNVIVGNICMNSATSGGPQARGIFVTGGTNNNVTGNTCIQNTVAQYTDSGTTTTSSANVVT